LATSLGTSLILLRWACSGACTALPLPRRQRFVDKAALESSLRQLAEEMDRSFGRRSRVTRLTLSRRRPLIKCINIDMVMLMIQKSKATFELCFLIWIPILELAVGMETEAAA